MSITDMELQAPVVGVAARLAAVSEELGLLLRGLDVAGLSGAEAAEVTVAFARVERLGMAGKTLAAGRVAASGYCRQAGFPDARRWLADATKASPGRRPRPSRPGPTWPPTSWPPPGRPWWRVA